MGGPRKALLAAVLLALALTTGDATSRVTVDPSAGTSPDGHAASGPTDGSLDPFGTGYRTAGWEDPASKTLGGASAVTITSPKGRRTVSGLGELDIPAAALRAYQRSVTVMAQASPSCGLEWSLLAAVGRVESDHGRYAGATLGDDGVSTPRIVGLPLDGAGPVAKIHDTDDGRLDGDEVWDRAVGPMQFIPGTWAVVGVDGDGDGVRSPHDIDDAALAAGVHLCAGAEDLRNPTNMRAALLRYNRSESYVTLVMEYENRYRSGHAQIAVAALPTAARPTAVPAEMVSSVRTKVSEAARHSSTAKPKPKGRETARPSAKAKTPVGVPPTAAPKPIKPPRTPEARSRPDEQPTAAPGAPEIREPAPAPDAEPAVPQPEEVVGPPTTEDPIRQPKEVPTTPPAVDDVGEPAPAPDAGPTAPEPERVTGTWTADGAGVWLDEHLLDLQMSDAATLRATADYDGDGEVEQVGDELAGLVERNVVVLVDKQPTGWLVLAINDLDYPGEPEDAGPLQP